MKRNHFLKKAIGGTIALFTFKWTAIAQKKEFRPEDKPLLTDGALNRFFAKCEEERNDGPLDEAIVNTRAFLEKYFSYISPQQRDRIAQIKKGEWRRIQAILRDAKQRKGSVDFKFINKPGNVDTVAQCAIHTRLLEKGNTQVELRKFIIQ
jgi:hypothetical protein